MKISLDPQNSKMKSSAAMNMSLADIIEADKKKKENEGNNRNVVSQGGNTNKNRQQQQQQQPRFQQQRNNQQYRGMNPMNQSSGSAKLIISNLDPGVSDADINTLFVEFGEIQEASVHYDRNGKSIGSAHVLFKRYGDAFRGQKKFNGITLDGRPMVIRVENVPFPNSSTGQQKTFNAKPPQANNQTGTGKKGVKRLQKGPQQPMAQKAPQQQRGFNQSYGKFPGAQQGGPRWPQQQSGMRWPPNIQMSYGVSNNYSMGYASPGYGLSMQGTGSSRGILGAAPPGILDRLGGVEPMQTLSPLSNQVMPSVLDRLDGGASFDTVSRPNNPVMPSVLTRLGGQVSSGGVGQIGGMGNLGVAGRIGGMGNSGVIGRLGGVGNTGALSRLGGVGNAGALGRLGGVGNTGALGRLGGMGSSGAVSRLGSVGNSGVAGRISGGISVKPGMKGRDRPYTNPGVKKVTPNKPGNKTQVNQPKKPQPNQQQPKKNINQPPQQSQQGGKMGKKTTPTAEELDAELDAYLREMTTAKK